MSQLDAADYESIDRAGAELHTQGWRKAFGLNEMFEAYERFVAQVEAGYDEMVDEYTNDLSCRDWLSLAWPLLTERVRDAHAAQLEGLDDRFRAATADDGGRALGRFFAVDLKDGWWWRRRPVNVGGTFAADLATPD